MLMETWRITMLGGLRVQRDAQVLTRFKSQKMASLLAYLAFYPNRPAAREELLALLWPDDDIEVTRNRLRVGLSSLRQQLEPPGTPAAAVLLADRLTIRLRPESFTTDTADFESAYAAALHAEAESERLPLLTKAVEAYGGPLLPGFYDEWILRERERLTQSHLEALRRLALGLAQSRNYERALQYARQAVQNDPFREEAHRDVMRLYVAVGQPTAALQQYAELCRLLEEALQATPAASTQQMAQQITNGLGHSAGPETTHFSPPALAPTTEHDAPSTLVTSAPFPAAREAGRLPYSLTRFFGRESELETLAARLTPAADVNGETRGSARLLTLIGIGGTGKTRLALALAERLRPAFADRVWFVPLAELSDPRLIADAIAGTMRLPRDPRADPLSVLLQALAQKPSLLVLDNFEHLAEGGSPFVAELLARLSLLTCLVTSRRSLGLPGEYEFPVAPLPVPGPVPLSPLLSFPSVQLFLDRAQAVLPYFQLTARNAEDIGALCRELEGIPLAIELAAARARILTPAQMRTHLKRRFDLLVNPRAEKDMRHRSLRATLEWSYALLPSDLRQLFAQLSVFAGGWDLQAAQAVCRLPGSAWWKDQEEGDEEEEEETELQHPMASRVPADMLLLDRLERLRIDSLILAAESEGKMRFSMLQTVREFAAEQLPGQEARALHRRFIHYFVSIAEQAKIHLKDATQSAWLQRLDRERDNLRVACSLCLDISNNNGSQKKEEINKEAGQAGLRLATSLQRFWTARGPLQEGREACAAALAHPGMQSPSLLRADALITAGALAMEADDFTTAQTCYAQALEVAQQTQYREGVAATLGNSGTLAFRLGDVADAHALLTQSLAIHRELGNIPGIALILSQLGLVISHQDPVQARDLYEQSLVLHGELGDRLAIAATLGNLGMLAERQGDYAAAQTFHAQSLAIHRELDNKTGIAGTLMNLGIVAAKQENIDGAQAYFQEALARFRELGLRRGIALALGNLGSLAELQGNPHEALLLHQESLSLLREINTLPNITHALVNLGNVCRDLQEHARSRVYLADALTIGRDIGWQPGMMAALEGFAALADARSQPERAAWLYGLAEGMREHLHAPLSSAMLTERQKTYARFRDALTVEGFTAAFSAGRTAHQEEAITDLLAEKF